MYIYYTKLGIRKYEDNAWRRSVNFSKKNTNYIKWMFVFT